MRIVTFEPSHLVGAKAHPKQVRYQYVINEGKIVNGWSALHDDRVVCFGGLVDTEDGIGAWLLFTDRIKPAQFLAVYKACREGLRILAAEGYRVIIDVEICYPEANRLAAALGFEPLRHTRHDGVEMMRMINVHEMAKADMAV